MIPVVSQRIAWRLEANMGPAISYTRIGMQLTLNRTNSYLTNVRNMHPVTSE